MMIVPGLMVEGQEKLVLIESEDNQAKKSKHSVSNETTKRTNAKVRNRIRKHCRCFLNRVENTAIFGRSRIGIYTLTEIDQSELLGRKA